MKILLHTCCAPCATYPQRWMREQGHDVTGFWYNPNIHPWLEHERRRDCLSAYAATVSLPMIWWPQYEMPLFLRRVSGKENDRCVACYAMRLGQTADVARDHGFHAISTTLLISPYQKHELIAEIGNQVADERGLKFVYEDFRKGWPERGRIAKEMGLYRQQYCGCIYSEYDRYTGSPLVIEPLPESRRQELAIS